MKGTTILMGADLRTIIRTCTLRAQQVYRLWVAQTRRPWLQPQRRWLNASTLTPVWPTLLCKVSKSCVLSTSAETNQMPSSRVSYTNSKTSNPQQRFKSRAATKRPSKASTIALTMSQRWGHRTFQWKGSRICQGTRQLLDWLQF